MVMLSRLYAIKQKIQVPQYRFTYYLLGGVATLNVRYMTSHYVDSNHVH